MDTCGSDRVGGVTFTHGVMSSHDDGSSPKRAKWEEFADAVPMDPTTFSQKRVTSKKVPDVSCAWTTMFTPSFQRRVYEKLLAAIQRRVLEKPAGRWSHLFSRNELSEFLAPAEYVFLREFAFPKDTVVAELVFTAAHLGAFTGLVHSPGVVGYWITNSKGAGASLVVNF